MDQRRHIQGIEQTANSIGYEGADNDRGADESSGRKCLARPPTSPSCAAKYPDIDNSSGRASSRHPSQDHRSLALRNKRYDIEMRPTTGDGGLGCSITPYEPLYCNSIFRRSKIPTPPWSTSSSWNARCPGASLSQDAPTRDSLFG
jgi:hypothetical protein